MKRIMTDLFCVHKTNRHIPNIIEKISSFAKRVKRSIPAITSSDVPHKPISHISAALPQALSSFQQVEVLIIIYLQLLNITV
jgi:hypothetical protein